MGSVAWFPLTLFATDNRFLSNREAAAIPKMENTSPIAILCRSVKPGTNGRKQYFGK